MAVTSGFFNAVDHDRLYDADDFGEIFNGIIKDGVFETVDQALVVQAGTGMAVNVQKGRAWFNGTWTINDASLPLTVPNADIILNRIDAIVLEVNKTQNVRTNSIKVVQGTAASLPVRPTMTHTDFINQYALAYIYVGHGVTNIQQANITNVVGTTETPFVIGLQESLSADQLYLQWQDAFETQLEQNESTFETWFEHLVDELSEQQAAHLQAQIDLKQNKVLYGTEDPDSSVGSNGDVYLKYEA